MRVTFRVLDRGSKRAAHGGDSRRRRVCPQGPLTSGVPAVRASSTLPARRRVADGSFTLIEVTAVLVLMAVLAGTATLALAGPRARAAAAEAVDQLAFADEAVRQAALSGDRPQTLVIDMAVGRLSRATDAAAGATLAELPAGVRVTRVLLGADVTDSGEARVTVSAGGLSSSYAVGLSTPAGPRWVVVAGLTGQVSTVPDAAAADAALDLVRPGQP